MYYNAAEPVAHAGTGGRAGRARRGRCDPCPVKGAVLAHTAYPDLSCRAMGDLDLWIDLDAMLRAQAALENLGYVQRLDTKRPLALQAPA